MFQTVYYRYVQSLVIYPTRPAFQTVFHHLAPANVPDVAVVLVGGETGQLPLVLTSPATTPASAPPTPVSRRVVPVFLEDGQEHLFNLHRYPWPIISTLCLRRHGTLLQGELLGISRVILAGANAPFLRLLLLQVEAVHFRLSIPMAPF